MYIACGRALARRTFSAAASRAAAPHAHHTIVLMRHGQSAWNLENRFTGWVDVPLTSDGQEEARRGGRALRAAGFEFDAAYTSVLKRAIKTCWLALEELDQMHIPITNDWRLNERHYGALSGLDKAETAKRHGEAQVTLWRRSYDVPPPPMVADHPLFIGKDRRYANVPPRELPATESLATTGSRVVPFWNSVLKPAVAAGKRLLVVAHGNSLRALVKHIDGISNEEIIGTNIPTGIPLVYSFDAAWQPIKHRDAIGPLSGYYVGDRDAILAEVQKVAHQASVKK